MNSSALESRDHGLEITTLVETHLIEFEYILHNIRSWKVEGTAEREDGDRTER